MYAHRSGKSKQTPSPHPHVGRSPHAPLLATRAQARRTHPLSQMTTIAQEFDHRTPRAWPSAGAVSGVRACLPPDVCCQLPKRAGNPTKFLMDRILRRCGPARVRIDKSKPRTHKHSALPPLAHTLKLQTESLITVLAMQLALFDQALFEKLR